MAEACQKCGKRPSDHRVIQERLRCEDGLFYASDAPSKRKVSAAALERRVQHLIRAAEQTMDGEPRGSTAYIAAKAAADAYHRVLNQIREV